LCCTINQRSIPFGYFLHLLAQSSSSPPGFTGVFIAEEVDGIGNKRSGDNTIFDVQIFLEALLNWYLRSACFTNEAFSGKKSKTFGIWTIIQKCWIIRIPELQDVRITEFCFTTTHAGIIQDTVVQ